MLKWVQDLRFVIGFFFGIVSIILLFAGITNPSELNVNLFGSLYLGVFSVVMVGLGVWNCES